MRAIRLLVLLVMLVVGQGKAFADIVRFVGNPWYDIDSRVSIIEAAQEEIYFQVFLTGGTSDPMSLQFMALLYRAANDPDRNVNVYIVTDWFADHKNDPLLRAMRFKPDGKTINERMHVKIFDQLLTDPLMIDNRMHNKLLVVDGKYAVLGGRNMSNIYFDLDCANAQNNYLDADVLVVNDRPHPPSLPQLYALPSNQLGDLSAPERLQRYAHSFFIEDKKQVQDPVTFLGIPDTKEDAAAFKILLEAYNKLITPMSIAGKTLQYKGREILAADFVFNKTLANGNADSACTNESSDTGDRESILGVEENNENLRNKLKKYGANVGPVLALFDPPDRPLKKNESDDIAMQLQDTLRNEFTYEKLMARGLDKTLAIGWRDPQLIIISPYVSMTAPMKQALEDIKANIDRANRDLAAMSERPLQFDLQIITNSDKNTDEVAAQTCFDEKSAPEYLRLNAKLFEYAGDLNSTSAIKRTGRIHQKMYLVNREKVFIGSFNTDYRSSNLNLELGVYFDISGEDPQSISVRNGILSEIYFKLKGYTNSNILNAIKFGQYQETGNADMKTIRSTPKTGLLFNTICYQQ